MFNHPIALESPTGQTESYSKRDCYRILDNAELFPHEALPLAKRIVENVLSATPIEPPFDYTEETFEKWLKGLYAESHQQSRQPHFLESGSSKAMLAEYLFQKSPQNFNDGTFLAKVGTIGLCSPVETALMKIKFEEAGSGIAGEHHGNLFQELLAKEFGIALSAANLHEDQRLIDSAFDDPVFQLAIAQFPRTYQPEILGMTLLLEWTGCPDAFRMEKVLKKRGIAPKFYAVHVQADNPRNGHAFQVKEAIERYLREIDTDSDRQLAWRRIYQGWHSWKCIMENFERQLRQHLIEFAARLAA
jgi:hypothetical protein